MKANPHLTLHEQMIIFLTEKQGQTEFYDDYLSKFNSSLENINLDGDAHVLCSPLIIGKYLSQCTTTEINAEKKKFMTMCFILRANKSLYRDILE